MLQHWTFSGFRIKRGGTRETMYYILQNSWHQDSATKSHVTLHMCKGTQAYRAPENPPTRIQGSHSALNDNKNYRNPKYQRDHHRTRHINTIIPNNLNHSETTYSIPQNLLNSLIRFLHPHIVVNHSAALQSVSWFNIFSHEKLLAQSTSATSLHWKLFDYYADDYNCEQCWIQICAYLTAWFKTRTSAKEPKCTSNAHTSQKMRRVLLRMPKAR